MISKDCDSRFLKQNSIILTDIRQLSTRSHKKLDNNSRVRQVIKNGITRLNTVVGLLQVIKLRFDKVRMRLRPHRQRAHYS